MLAGSGSYSIHEVEDAVRRRPIDEAVVGSGGSAAGEGGGEYMPEVSRTAGRPNGGDGEAGAGKAGAGHTFVPRGVKPFALVTELSTKGAKEEATIGCANLDAHSAMPPREYTTRLPSGSSTIR